MNNISKKFHNNVSGLISAVYSKLRNNLVTSVFIVLVAALVFAFFGFNANTNLAHNSYYTKIGFGTELTSAQVDTFKKDVNDILKQNGYKNYTVSYEGEDSDNIILVEILVSRYTDTQKIEENFDTTRVQIENKLNSTNEFYNLKVSDLHTYKTAFNGNFVLKIALPILVLIAAFAVYTLIMLDAASLIALTLGLVHDLLLMLSFIIIFRIQTSSFIILPFVALAIYSVITNFTNLYQIKEVFRNGKNGKQTNAQVAANISTNNIKSHYLPTVTLLLLGIALIALCTGISITQGITVLIFTVVIVLYSSFAIVPVIWSKLYNRENDIRLQKSIELKNKPKKEEDSIVV